MRYICPHCREPGVGVLAKWLSGNVRAAACSTCGRFSEVRSTTARQCSAAALVVAGLSVLGFVIGRWHPAWLWAGLGLSFGVYLLTWHLAVLEPADTGGWKLGRNGLISLFGLVLLGAWWLLRTLP